MPERYDPETIADDLGECRQRGLDWLDRTTSTQRPIAAAALQELAAEYVRARGLLAPGRIAQIKILLVDGITELGRQGHPADATLLRDLFFGSSADVTDTIRSPGELLQSARKRTGETEQRFRERRNALMRSFAQFLITFARSVQSALGEADAPTDPDAGLYKPRIGSAPDSDHFIGLLANAVNATIVGITNERLLPALKLALSRKREVGPPDAFWNSLRIVFLSESLLGAVSDDREEFHDSVEASRQRRLERTWAHRSIGVFLKRTQSTRWALYEWQYLPVLVGSLFELQDGRKVVHLVIRAPRRPAADYLFIDVTDQHDELTVVFEDIVHHSAIDTMIVPVGAPSGQTFACNEVRPQARVLKDGSGASGWLPMVIVITSRVRNGRTEPLLQLRTVQNAAREENRLSHLGGHVLHEDRARPSGREVAEVPRTFDLLHETPLSAAERLVRTTGADPRAVLRPMTTGRYLYPDKEHLFFFVFALELPENLHFPRRAEMHSFRVSELLAIRESQVLNSVIRLCQDTQVSQRAFAAAAEVLALNLTLHDHQDLAATMLALVRQSAEARAAVAAAVSDTAVDRIAPSWMEPRGEVVLEGLAGWHYREFFSVLLPLYAKIGVDEAAGICAAIDADERKRDARDRLAELYQDEHFVEMLADET